LLHDVLSECLVSLRPDFAHKNKKRCGTSLNMPICLPAVDASLAPNAQLSRDWHAAIHKQHFLPRNDHINARP
jgi:hypothetical protein